MEELDVKTDSVRYPLPSDVTFNQRCRLVDMINMLPDTAAAISKTEDGRVLNIIMPESISKESCIRLGALIGRILTCKL